MEAVSPEVSRATTSGAQVGAGSATLACTGPHSLNAPYVISATASPTFRPACRLLSRCLASISLPSDSRKGHKVTQARRLLKALAT